MNTTQREKEQRLHSCDKYFQLNVTCDNDVDQTKARRVNETLIDAFALFSV
ncbi:MAG: hypothetical protein AB7P13_06715 [Candidatus Nitrosocosmicus sp.]